MYRATKSATCCYCGTHAVLELGGEGTHHELRCSACGAPLSRLKAMPMSRTHAPPKGGRDKKTYHRKPSKPAKKKKRRGWGYYLSEAAEEIFDIFD